MSRVFKIDAILNHLSNAISVSGELNLTLAPYGYCRSARLKTVSLHLNITIINIEILNIT